MAITSLIVTYGHWFVLVGILVADIPTLLIAGFLIRQGYLSLPVVLIAAVVSRGLFEIILFSLGRFSQLKVRRSKTLDRLTNRALKQIENHQLKILLIYHFIQGIKLGIPIASGISTIKFKHFVSLNFVGLIIWATIMLGLGLAFGQSFMYLAD